MADFKFDLVSPERRLAQMDATEVQIPGADGDMTAMADHAPTITTLRPGILTVTHAGGVEDYVVSGGFAEITGTGVSVLAEKAFPKSEATAEQMEKLVADATVAFEAAKASGNGADEADMVRNAMVEVAAAVA
ncbi:F0F1 ATP synthase subunit epsilon [Octadecabacter sp. G9-8]|uniref:ATP synthase epsilon chain n=1 Tax=Octadecabacter dasysiphoniae TaxID=2909341 RepID=A0ABS9CSH8_9RHOB|nr:F0F1 ATP synthase subunit epsilon [Octadecabacter dasysiphoniae]MCF2869707.1 F0F1 ATP synthase subunit epsilon [Octadecabacter dasysiphoniae]